MSVEKLPKSNDNQPEDVPAWPSQIESTLMNRETRLSPEQKLISDMTLRVDALFATSPVTASKPMPYDLPAGYNMDEISEFAETTRPSILDYALGRSKELGQSNGRLGRVKRVDGLTDYFYHSSWYGVTDKGSDRGSIFYTWRLGDDKITCSSSSELNNTVDVTEHKNADFIEVIYKYTIGPFIDKVNKEVQDKETEVADNSSRCRRMLGRIADRLM